MIVASVIERLTRECAGLFALVEGAGELTEVTDRLANSPAAFVVPTREISGDNERATGGVLQRTEIDFTVVIITDNRSDHRGGAAAADIDPLKAAVRKALIGWVPVGAEDLVTHVGGELSKSRGGSVWWEDTFATAAYLEQETPA